MPKNTTGQTSRTAKTGRKTSKTSRKDNPNVVSINPKYSGNRKFGNRKKKANIENLNEVRRGTAITRSTKVVAALFFAFVAIYILRTVIAFFTTPEIPVEMVRLGNVEAPQTISGIIVRNETVYTAPTDGLTQFNFNYNDRVRPSTVVATIQNVQDISAIQQSLERVEEQILQLQELRGDLSAVYPNIRRINSQIQNMVDERLNRHISLDLSEAYSLRDSIVQNVNMRNRMIVTENLDANIRAELGINHQILMSQLDENSTPIQITHGGIVATIIDGLESQLNFETMFQLTREQTLQTVDFNQIIPQREVAEGDNVFKIVNSNLWYIAAYIDNEIADDLTVGNANIPLFVDNRAAPIFARVFHIEQGYEDSLVIFRVPDFMTEFLNMRNISFRLTETVQQGLQIPNTAIVEQVYLAIPLDFIRESELRYVVRVVGDETLNIPITVVDQDEYVALVPEDTEMLEIGNTLRHNTDMSTMILTEVRSVHGVFREINGIATFVPIYVTEEFQPTAIHTILNPSQNLALPLYSHIITNAALVQDGDIVFSGVR
ncbi:MAG: hypothetical protein FWG64_10625 [Firmicutes bacterium]|nr:hypothetical protein [Bacillota bacterium]